MHTHTCTHTHTLSHTVQAIARLATFRKRLAAHRTAMRIKDENKAVSLSTAKINYMDPRITVAWCKRVRARGHAHTHARTHTHSHTRAPQNEVPIEKVFARTLRDKFPWAMATEPDWTFNVGGKHLALHPEVES